MCIRDSLKFIAEEYGWNAAQLGNLGGILLGIFLIGYGISNVFLSPFIDKVGAKRVLIISIVSWSLTLFIAASLGHFYSVLLLSRLLLGLTQGVLFPAANKVTAFWFPENERARASSVFLSGGAIGSMITPLILIPIILKKSWKFAFYFAGLIGILLVPLIAVSYTHLTLPTICSV